MYDRYADISLHKLQVEPRSASVSSDRRQMALVSLPRQPESIVGYGQDSYGTGSPVTFRITLGPGRWPYLMLNPRTDGGPGHLSTDGGGRITAPPPEISKTKQDGDKR